MKKITVATCQFPVSGDVHRNAAYIRRLIKKAAARKAHVVHFCEAALTGYPGVDMPSFKRTDWDAVRSRTGEIMALARSCDIWVILGSAHYVDTDIPPTNCLYIISSSGRLVSRYDKHALTENDEIHYSPGTQDVAVTINGVKCGFLICADTGNPWLTMNYKNAGSPIVFMSFQNRSTNRAAKGKTIYEEYVPARIRTRAYDSRLWIVANNTATPYSAWPACIASPDGVLVKSMHRHETGICVHTISIKKEAVLPAPPKQQITDHPRQLDLKSAP